jgi:hypothetical protein
MFQVILAMVERWVQLEDWWAHSIIIPNNFSNCLKKFWFIIIIIILIFFLPLLN